MLLPPARQDVCDTAYDRPAVSYNGRIAASLAQTAWHQTLLMPRLCLL